MPGTGGEGQEGVRGGRGRARVHQVRAAARGVCWCVGGRGGGGHELGCKEGVIWGARRVGSGCRRGSVEGKEFSQNATMNGMQDQINRNDDYV